MTNAAFEEYYQEQGIVPEGEWDAFMVSLRTTLPTTFRINGSGKFAEELRTRLETDFLTSFSGGPIKVIACMAFHNFTWCGQRRGMCISMLALHRLLWLSCCAASPHKQPTKNPT